MSDNPKCNHKPSPGFRELFGQEKEDHISAMESFGYVSRRRTTVERRQSLEGTCLHVYLKIDDGPEKKQFDISPDKA